MSIVMAPSTLRSANRMDDFLNGGEVSWLSSEEPWGFPKAILKLSLNFPQK